MDRGGDLFIVLSVAQLSVSLKCILLFIHDDNFGAFVGWFNNNVFIIYQLLEGNAIVFTKIVCAVRICYVMAESCWILCQELFDRLAEI